MLLCMILTIYKLLIAETLTVIVWLDGFSCILLFITTPSVTIVARILVYFTIDSWKCVCLRWFDQHQTGWFWTSKKMLIPEFGYFAHSRKCDINIRQVSVDLYPHCREVFMNLRPLQAFNICQSDVEMRQNFTKILYIIWLYNKKMIRTADNLQRFFSSYCNVT
jgi:hypothetical protein